MFLDVQVKHCLVRLKFDTRLGRIMAKEETYAPLSPAVTFVSTSGNIKVVTKLYGDVSNGRLDRERVVSQRRAEQLNLTRIERIERVREEE